MAFLMTIGCAADEDEERSGGGTRNVSVRLTHLGDEKGGFGTTWVPERHPGCGPEGLNCLVTMPAGTHIKVVAWPHFGSRFVGFGGACSGKVCELDVLDDIEITATFELE